MNLFEKISIFIDPSMKNGVALNSRIRDKYHRNHGHFHRYSVRLHIFLVRMIHAKRSLYDVLAYEIRIQMRYYVEIIKFCWSKMSKIGKMLFFTVLKHGK